MTAGTDLILRGNVTLGGTDVSAEILGVTFKAYRNDIVVPATFVQGITHAPGAQHYEAMVDYLSDDSGDNTLFNLLWAAALTDSKELAITARLRDGAIGVSNPQWNATVVVTAADIGGDMETLSQGTVTLPCTGKPTKTTS